MLIKGSNIGILPLFFASFFAHAGAMQEDQPHNFAGSYVGIGVGGQLNQFKSNTQVSFLFPSSAFFSSSSNEATLFSSNAVGAIYAGHLFAIKSKYYLGPEIYGAFGKPQFSTIQSAQAVLPVETLQTKTSGHLNSGEFGIDAVLGGELTPTMLLLGRVGVAFNRIHLNATTNDSRPYPLNASVASDTSSFKPGLRLGLGMQQKLTERFHVRADYIYTQFHEISASYIGTSDPSLQVVQLGPIHNSTSLKVSTNTLMVSLVYSFNDWSL